MADKKENLEKDIQEFVRKVLAKAEKEATLDHFSIEISNHNGNLQMDHTLRERKRSY